MIDNNNNNNKLPFPMEVFNKVLPTEGTSVKLGEEVFTKIEYQGKAYIIHWMPAIRVVATAAFEDFDKEISLLNQRKTAVDTLIQKFNELSATPVALEAK